MKTLNNLTKKMATRKMLAVYLAVAGLVACGSGCASVQRGVNGFANSRTPLPQKMTSIVNILPNGIMEITR